MSWIIIAAAGVALIIVLIRLQPRSRPASIRHSVSIHRPTPSRRRRAELAGDGGYDYELVGESHYQDHLETIAGRSEDGGEHECRALLVADRGNPHDAHAVRVCVAGATVGYIRREDAPEVRALIEAHGALECDAVIAGGWDRGARGRGHFGVRLDMTWPPDVV